MDVRRARSQDLREAPAARALPRRVIPNSTGWPTAVAARRAAYGLARLQIRICLNTGRYKRRLYRPTQKRYDLLAGPAFIELYYETEWYEAPPELRPSLKN